MRNSLIFFKKTGAKKFTYNNWDCCQSLGQAFKDQNSGTDMYVGIPIYEMDSFFLIEDRRNLVTYLNLISEAFDINYSIATPEEIAIIDVTGYTTVSKEDILFVKINTKKDKSNKWFNASYNTFRYLWYQQYTRMAIIATNLYNLNVCNNIMDVLAIAFSYQDKGDRALLPKETLPLKGILFFRDKVDVIPELVAEKNFNSIFYRYPVYFDPEIKIKGLFFEDSEAVIKAKEVFGKLVGIDNIGDLPKQMINNIRLIYEDYSLMKESYLMIKAVLDKGGYAISFDTPVLLSRGLATISIRAITPNGNSTTVKIDLRTKTKTEVIDEILDSSEFKMSAKAEINL